jgi:molybdate transport system substrate-binding protein
MMRIRSVIMVAAGLLGCGAPREPEVQVFAAASLREVLEEIASVWTGRAGRGVRLQFEATSTLARQVEQGAPADVFAVAAPEWLDRRRPLERYDWLSNRLVLVVPREAPDPDLGKLRSLALAGEQVPAGRYARAALDRLGVRLPDRVIYGAHVRDVLSKVAQGGAEAGVVYATDARMDPRVRVGYVFPAESHPKIVYAVGLLRPGGKPFFAALREEWAQEIARRHGFAAF